VRDAAGHNAELAAFGGLARFDILPLLAATDGAESPLTPTYRGPAS
jgi:hypothetical protein